MRTVFEYQGEQPNRSRLSVTDWWRNHGINPIRNNQYRRIGIPATAQMLENLIHPDQRDAKEINPQDIDFERQRNQWFRVEDGRGNHIELEGFPLVFLEYYMDTEDSPDSPFYTRGTNGESTIRRSEVNAKEFLKKFKVYKIDPPGDEE